MGIIDFTFVDGNIIVNTFSQDSYLNTPGGTLAIDLNSVSGMGGSIDNSGNMEFDPTGRIAVNLHLKLTRVLHLKMTRPSGRIMA